MNNYITMRVEMHAGTPYYTPIVPNSVGHETYGQAAAEINSQLARYPDNVYVIFRAMDIYQVKHVVSKVAAVDPPEQAQPQEVTHGEG